jgi:hypothetical protein
MSDMAGNAARVAVECGGRCRDTNLKSYVRHPVQKQGRPVSNQRSGQAERLRNTRSRPLEWSEWDERHGSESPRGRERGQRLSQFKESDAEIYATTRNLLRHKSHGIHGALNLAIHNLSQGFGHARSDLHIRLAFTDHQLLSFIVGAVQEEDAYFEIDSLDVVDWHTE